MAAAVEGTTSKVRTFIWGSCVSRDTFEFLPESHTLVGYAARQSLISAGNEVAAELRTKLTDPESLFQRRMVHGDLDGNLYAELRASATDIDLLLIDLVDERGGVIAFDDSYATKLNEFWRAGGQEASRGRPHIALGTDAHYDLWAEGVRRFIEVLNENDLLRKAVVLSTPWASTYENGEELEIPDWMTPPQEANAAYSRYFELLAQQGLPIIHLPVELASTSRAHQWGPSPFHYQAAAYEHLASNISERTWEKSPEERVRSNLHKRRDTSQWGAFEEVGNIAELHDIELSTGYVTLWHNGIPIDFYIQDNGSDTTLVNFHAALGRSKMTPPVFTGRAISDDIGINRIFVSDPGLLTSEDLGLAWYIGTDRLDLTTILVDAVKALTKRLETKHLVFFGMSGGGFASLNIGHEFRDSLALPVNPQTSILKYAEVHWDAMARACFNTKHRAGSLKRLSLHPRADQTAVYGDGFSNRVIYVQNKSDAHISTHLIPWFDAINWSTDASILLGDWGKGHVPPTGTVLRALLSDVARASGDWSVLEKTVGAENLDRQKLKLLTGR